MSLLLYSLNLDASDIAVSSATIDAAGTSLTLALTKAGYVGAGGNAGFTITPSGGAATLTYASGSGTFSLVYTISRAIGASETATVGYVNPGDGIEDSLGADLADFDGFAATNDSTHSTAPTDITLSNSSVLTTGGVNAVVGTFSTTDADTGDTFTYSLVAGTGDTNNASFNISGANLRCGDPETLGAGTYSIRVRSTDAAAATYDEVFSITVAEPSTNAMTLVRSISRPISMSISRNITG